MNILLLYARGYEALAQKLADLLGQAGLPVVTATIDPIDPNAMGKAKKRSTVF